VPCGCNKKKVYVVTHGDGTMEEVTTLTQAMTLARKTGGHYQLVTRQK
jgi:hypothetical protein